jgi:hypothetical protein
MQAAIGIGIGSGQSILKVSVNGARSAPPFRFSRMPAPQALVIIYNRISVSGGFRDGVRECVGLYRSKWSKLCFTLSINF